MKERDKVEKARLRHREGKRDREREKGGGWKFIIEYERKG